MIRGDGSDYRTVRVSCRLLLERMVVEKLLDEIHVGEKHATTAIPDKLKQYKNASSDTRKHGKLAVFFLRGKIRDIFYTRSVEGVENEGNKNAVPE